jgi:hypothetical protein
MKTQLFKLSPEEVLLVWSALFEKLAEPEFTAEERRVAERLMGRLDFARGGISWP